MTEHESHSPHDASDPRDSKADVIAATSLVVLAAAFCIYWVSAQ